MGKRQVSKTPNKKKKDMAGGGKKKGTPDKSHGA
jgi:hypothetical protein